MCKENRGRDVRGCYMYNVWKKKTCSVLEYASTRVPVTGCDAGEFCPWVLCDSVGCVENWSTALYILYSLYRVLRAVVNPSKVRRTLYNLTDTRGYIDALYQRNAACACRCKLDMYTIRNIFQQYSCGGVPAAFEGRKVRVDRCGVRPCLCLYTANTTHWRFTTEQMSLSLSLEHREGLSSSQLCVRFSRLSRERQPSTVQRGAEWREAAPAPAPYTAVAVAVECSSGFGSVSYAFGVLAHIGLNSVACTYLCYVYVGTSARLVRHRESRYRFA